MNKKPSSICYNADLASFRLLSGVGYPPPFKAAGRLLLRTAQVTKLLLEFKKQRENTY